MKHGGGGGGRSYIASVSLIPFSIHQSCGPCDLPPRFAEGSEESATLLMGKIPLQSGESVLTEARGFFTGLELIEHIAHRAYTCRKSLTVRRPDSLKSLSLLLQRNHIGLSVG